MEKNEVIDDRLDHSKRSVVVGKRIQPSYCTTYPMDGSMGYQYMGPYFYITVEVDGKQIERGVSRDVYEAVSIGSEIPLAHQLS